MKTSNLFFIHVGTSSMCLILSLPLLCFPFNNHNNLLYLFKFFIHEFFAHFALAEHLGNTAAVQGGQQSLVAPRLEELALGGGQVLQAELTLRLIAVNLLQFLFQVLQTNKHHHHHRHHYHCHHHLCHRCHHHHHTTVIISQQSSPYHHHHNH